MREDDRRESDRFIEDERPLSYWRTLSADSFDRERRTEVAACVASIHASAPAWQAAIVGSAEAAIGLVERLKTPTSIGLQVDLTMTVLLNAAFTDEEAALVLAHTVKRMPLDISERERLSASWEAYRGREQQRGPLF
ncbi:hypothetical protein JQ594_00685 [Bradyrhizobium manausense]|uniref:hypothetical protein n=1 Tax=Bradyrhizobium manausense TaxID=989370 RepID=UPI001BADA423|nr:hypothetical protein [Bradyrhizobium manausense]MBR0684418.1 hypothetical protein [Bradyrhizobium manausense]